MEDGRWKMEDGRWKMEDGRWKKMETLRADTPLEEVGGEGGLKKEISIVVK